MDIKLIPAGNGSKFTFPALPEKVQGKYGAKYQSFDIIFPGYRQGAKRNGCGRVHMGWRLFRGIQKE